MLKYLLSYYKVTIIHSLHVNIKNILINVPVLPGTKIFSENSGTVIHLLQISFMSGLIKDSFFIQSIVTSHVAWPEITTITS